jgi:hypothetical protein
MPLASTASGPVSVGFNPTLVVPAGVGRISQATFADNITNNTNYANGTGALQYDIYVSKIIALVASTPLTDDLSSQTDVNGTVQTPLRVREILLCVPSLTLANFVKVSGGVTNPVPFAGGIVFPGNAWTPILRDPTSVGTGIGAFIDATHKTIKYDPGALNITLYAIYLMCSAVS